MLLHPAFYIHAISAFVPVHQSPPPIPEVFSEEKATKLGKQFLTKLLKAKNIADKMYINERVDCYRLEKSGNTYRTIISQPNRRWIITSAPDINSFIESIENSSPKVYGGILSGVPEVDIVLLKSNRKLLEFGFNGAWVINCEFSSGSVQLSDITQLSAWFTQRGIGKRYYN